MKIAIVGCGTMGIAFAKSFLQYNILKKEEILLIEKNEDRRKKLQEESSGVTVEIITEEISSYDLVMLSVKPQDLPSIEKSLAKHLRPHQTVLSIMAGITIDYLSKVLNHKSIVRAMPNTPALVGMGMTAYAVSNEVNIKQLHSIENMLNCTGRTIYLEDESYLDAVTALSGSGPAYFYYLVKAMVDAGKKMGFEEGVATLLVKQTMLGAFHLINQADKSLEELIKAVASKGGTTEAALSTFEEMKVAENLIKGIEKAQKRAKELSIRG